MPPNPPEFEKLVQSLNEHHVRFVVIGGLAMVLHGSDYSTVDSDFAVESDLSSVEPIVQALAAFNPRPSHWPDGTPFVWDARSIFGSVVSLTTDAGDVDLLRVVPGVDSFEGLWDRSLVKTVFGEQVHFASIDDMIKMKIAANRPKDQNHILELRAISALSEELGEG